MAASKPTSHQHRSPPAGHSEAPPYRARLAAAIAAVTSIGRWMPHTQARWASVLAPVFPGCHVFCRPATYHGIEPPPVLPSLDKRAGIEPALSLLVAGADLRHGLAKCDPTQAHQPAHSPTRKRAVHAEFVWVRPGFGTTAHAPVQFCTPALFLVGPRYFPGVVVVQRLRPLCLRVAPWLHRPVRVFRLPIAGLYFANIEPSRR